MATNVFFQPYNFQNEQRLIENLVIESIRIYGVDTYYVMRTTQDIDNVLNEDRLSIFTNAFNMEMYVKTVDGFQGEGDFLSKFGLQIRDQATFTVAIRTFEKYATVNVPTLNRPREGDLVYMPMNNKFFKVMFVEHESVFYQTGALQVYDLKCELFEYSNERFETGVAEIDTAYAAYNTVGIDTLADLRDVDPVAKNIYYSEAILDSIDFTNLDPFSEAISTATNYNPVSDSDLFDSDTTTVTTDPDNVRQTNFHKYRITT